MFVLVVPQVFLKVQKYVEGGWSALFPQLATATASWAVVVGNAWAVLGVQAAPPGQHTQPQHHKKGHTMQRGVLVHFGATDSALVHVGLKISKIEKSVSIDHTRNCIQT